MGLLAMLHAVPFQAWCQILSLVLYYSRRHFSSWRIWGIIYHPSIKDPVWRISSFLSNDLLLFFFWAIERPATFVMDRMICYLFWAPPTALPKARTERHFTLSAAGLPPRDHRPKKTRKRISDGGLHEVAKKLFLFLKAVKHCGSIFHVFCCYIYVLWSVGLSTCGMPPRAANKVLRASPKMIWASDLVDDYLESNWRRDERGGWKTIASGAAEGREGRKTNR